ncbi:MAG: PocR ligand-binding domain-containing protein [Lachnospiraceae bacterium]|nr:PocR ligand-binding domain-containing protein [Lachnospiraceae bacterium]
MNQFVLTDLIPPSTLQKLQDAFSNYSGMAALTTDSNGAAVTEGSNFTKFCMELTRKSPEGCKNCEACDRQGAIITLQTGRPAVYRCHAGLVDYAAPIMVEGEFVGSFIGGQIRVDPVNEAEFVTTAKKYGIDPVKYVNAAKATNQIPEKDIEKAAEFLSEMAGVLSQIAYQRYVALQKSQSTERTVRSQSEFISQLSADLKNNVNELAEYLSHASEVEGSAKEKVDSLLHRAAQLGGMMEDTVDYLNLTEGDFSLSETTYDVAIVVDKFLEEIRPELENAGHAIHLLVSESLPSLMLGDPSNITQILRKLVECSAKREDSETTEINITCSKDSYATLLTIRIADFSVIGPEELDSIRSYLGNTNKSVIENQDFSMLGYATIGHLLSKMAGKIIVNSNDHGTEYILTIPQLAVVGGGL